MDSYGLVSSFLPVGSSVVLKYYFSGSSIAQRLLLQQLSLFVCTVLARAARMSKLKCQIHQLIMDFVPGKVTTGGRFRTSTNLPPFSCCSHKLHTSGVCAATRDCGSILAIVGKFANSQPGNLLPPSSSRAISFTISISALATKTGNKSKVIKAVAQR